MDILVHLAQLVERKTFNLVVMGSSPICDTILRSIALLVKLCLLGGTRRVYL